jgi:hypothetical protein
VESAYGVIDADPQRGPEAMADLDLSMERVGERYGMW